MENNKLSRPAFRHMKDSTTIERILAWYEQGDPNTVVLTDHEMKKKERLKAVFMLLTRDRDNSQIVKILTKQFGITEPTVYQDIKDARILFGEINKTAKEADKVIMLNKIRRGTRKAWKSKDLKAYQKFLDMEVKVLGLDRDDSGVPAVSAIDTNQYMIGYFPEELGIDIIANPEDVARKFLAKTKNISAEEIKIESTEDGTKQDSL